MSNHYLLEVKMTNPRPPHNQEWRLVQSVKDEKEGLAVASRMSTAYDYRLYIGPDHGYKYLEWVEDPKDTEMSIPEWRYR